MRKIVCGLLMGCLVLIMLPVSSARAAEMAEVSISTPSSVPAGGSFVARLNFSGVANLNSYQLQLSYNQNIIQIEGEEGGTAGVTPGWAGSTSIPVDWWTFSPPGAQGGKIRVVGHILNNQFVSGSGCLAEIHFNVIGSPGQNTLISFDQSDIFQNGLFNVYSFPIATAEPWGSARVLIFQISNTNLAEGALGLPYTCNMTAEGGTAPYHWTGTGLPSGLAVSDEGTISGTPMEAGDFPVNFSVTDSNVTPNTSRANLTLRIYAPLQITGSALPAATRGKSYSYTLDGEGGKPPYTWSSATLPSGLSISTAGNIIGIPSVSGDYGAIITVRDSFSPVISTSKTLSIHIYAPLEVSTTLLPTAYRGEAYSATAIASGGKSPYIWSASGLPAGLNMSSTGNITGTPAEAGDFNVDFSVSDSFDPANTAGKALNLHVNDAVMIVDSVLNDGTVGSQYNASLAAGGGVPPYVWSGTGLPSGLALLSTGIISGIPAEAGDYNLHLTVADSSSPPRTMNKTLSLHIYSALNITSLSLPGGLPGSGYSGSLTASGGKPPYIWTVSGLPAGLSAAENGVISGIPTETGNFNLDVSVSDSSFPANIKSRTISLKIYNTGDANGDGKINMGDVTRVELIILGLAAETPGADANGDGDVNMGDVTRIEMIILGLA
jgi:hypothetical protein